MRFAYARCGILALLLASSAEAIDATRPLVTVHHDDARLETVIRAMRPPTSGLFVRQNGCIPPGVEWIAVLPDEPNELRAERIYFATMAECPARTFDKCGDSELVADGASLEIGRRAYDGQMVRVGDRAYSEIVTAQLPRESVRSAARSRTVRVRHCDIEWELDDFDLQVLADFAAALAAAKTPAQKVPLIPLTEEPLRPATPP